MKTPSKKKLMAYSESVESGCRVWSKSKNSYGYGKVADGRGSWMLAHRASWIAHYGEIPEGLSVCHHCDNPACIEPSHLFLGTHAENMRDMKRKGRASSPRGEDRKNAKITECDVRRIRSSAEKTRDIARELGISVQMVTRIRRRASWAHVQ